MATLRTLAPPPATRDGARDADTRYSDLVMTCDQGVLVAVDSIIVLANDTAVGLFGATRTEDVVGRPLTDFVKEVTPMPAQASQQPVGQPGAPYVKTTAHRLDRTSLAVQIAAIRCRYRDREAVQMLVRSAGQRNVLERRVQFLMRHDILTGLPNRTEFRDRLIGAIARAQRTSRQMAIMLLGVDHFSAINTRHGPEIGDFVLQEIAVRIKSCIRLTDVAARLGGVEFGVILEGLDQREQAAVVANRIVMTLQPPISAGLAEVSVGCTAGVAGYPADAANIDDLLRKADVAMLAARDGGRGTFRFYFPEFEAVTRRDEIRRLEIDKRIALLTAREREVMDILVDGNSNKAVAYLLGASPRTIENHRAKVMSKMLAESLPDLVRMAMESGYRPKGLPR